MGKKIVLTGVTLTDLDAPKLATLDPIEAAGSLYLIEPGHPAEPWASGVPTNNTPIPNVVQSINGIADPVIWINSNLGDGTRGEHERSAKGGLHVIVSQSVTLGNNGSMVIMPATLASWLSANTGHSYYVSMWDRLTRPNTTPEETGYAYEYVTRMSSNTGLASVNALQWVPASGTTIANSRHIGNIVGPRFGNAEVVGVGDVSGTRPCGPVWGAPLNGVNNGASSVKWPSFVLYRFYVEDLTVSGRSYAEVDAIDHALYTKEVLTEGGRYYGDTFTDPATIP